MAWISTRTHAVGDYAGGSLMLAAARLGLVRDRRAAALLRVAGAATLALAAFTDYELGLLRKLPVKVHLSIDSGTGVVLGAAGLALRRSGAGARSWLPLALIGAGENVVSLLSERIAGDHVAAERPGAVTPPQEPQFDTERAEQVDAGPPDAGLPAESDTLVAQQESEAAAEAAAIGGHIHGESADPALAPVYEAGGGEQEGWEAAEADLIENATHGEPGASPERDALTPEIEADRSTAAYGEADEEHSSEVEDSDR